MNPQLVRDEVGAASLLIMAAHQQLGVACSGYPLNWAFQSTPATNHWSDS